MSTLFPILWQHPGVTLKMEFYILMVHLLLLQRTFNLKNRIFFQIFTHYILYRTQDKENC